MYRPPQKPKQNLFYWLISQIQKQKKDNDNLVNSLSKLNIKK